MTVWDRISILLSRTSVGKKDLAKICGVSPSAITKWVDGGGIDAVNIAKIAIHFSVTTDWILGVSDRSNVSALLHLPPSKKLKISKLREDATAAKTAIEHLAKAMAGLEKRIGELEGD
jgi:hypothetical protein